MYAPRGVVARKCGLSTTSRFSSRCSTSRENGTADSTVHPSNSDAIARQALDPAQAQSLQAEEHGQANGRDFRRSITYAPNGNAAIEHWTVEGLGHAWSGGQAAGSYADPKGPDASAEMIRFFLKHPAA